ncbi:Predicted O-linked N-acetylglucosamine transferase, SPINDLY family [Achromobacter spanius]|uniref:bifunctional class I SAM-dependent methyltransferase/glycosyltransferase n=1 Tax=Achromobacter spanius TaxID=217203 RepID=UPI000D98C62B|nr:bifunctional class I SAM-dependent methyltransferase/glycosyltransferase [Achromobacter spanius]CAB3628408.1 hypothetical protein LMG5911_00750 [Achromobacter spanius]SPT37431.1 Predicted O-linked N-acetylglucosamine transferase, SPINDLY family [Achromobacter denitrificans]VEE54754.1 Predicted O-linked N-acetylglucosamine transferase, SPINDLY family [Achromobacter spanius]
MLNCGAADGLLPFALANAAACVIGLDTRSDQIELGRRRLDELGLTNVTLSVSDLAQLPADIEPFDYIIVPALYDSLPAAQAHALLEHCKRLLSPLGLLYVDYRTYPGAKGLEVVRDAILLHTHSATTEAEVKAGARAALTLFKEGLAQTNPMGASVGAIAAQIANGLETDEAARLLACSPKYFIEFAGQATQAGLAYVGDADPLSEIPLELGQNVSLSHSLLSMGQPRPIRQQYLDFSSGRGFRQSLLVSQDREQEVLTAPELSRFADLSWASGLIRLAARGSDSAVSYVTHLGRGLVTTDPVMIELLTVLGRAWPSALPYATILKELIRGAVKDETTLQKSLSKCLKTLVEADLAHFCLGPAPYDQMDTVFRPLRCIPPTNTDVPLFNLWHEPLRLVFNDAQRALLGTLSSGQSLQESLESVAADPAYSNLGTGDLNDVLSLIKRFALMEGSAESWHALLEAGLIESEGRGHYAGLFVDALARIWLTGRLKPQPSVHPPASLLSQAQRLNQAMTRNAYSESEPLARTLTKLAPKFFDAWEALAITLCNTRRPAQALVATLRMLELQPNHAQSYITLAVCFSQLERTSEAISAGRRAVELAPADAHAHAALADALNTERRYQEAKASCLRALEIDPNLQKALANLSKILIDSGDAEGAIAAARNAVERAPKSLAANNNLLFALNYAPSVSAQEVYQAYQAYDQSYCLPLRNTWRPHKNSHQLHRKLKVGFTSPDFRQHSGNCFIEPLLTHLNREAFELTAYAELTMEDEATTRFKQYFDHWVPTAPLADTELADRIRADQIDILIDVAGHTAGNRLAVFARKPAPVSMTWLGYGYTTGVSAIDYILTDEAMAPGGSEELFAEKPWRLTNTNFIYRPGNSMGEYGSLPALSSGHVTLGSLTRAIRMNSRTIRVWATILGRLPLARLVVDSNSYRDIAMQEELITRFESQGVDRSRLAIGCHSPPWDTLRNMDIGLDCFPHNSGVTLVESLYMGVPFVTLADRPSVGRIGSSVLHGVGHPEWIAQTEEEYIEKVVALASDLPALAALRAGLREEMHASPLMDEPAFARKFEAALRGMFNTWCESQA